MSPKTAARAWALRRLRVQWALFYLAGALGLLAFSWLLFDRWSFRAVQQWLMPATFLFAYQVGVLWFDLPKNSTKSNGKLLPGFGAGTWISLLRLLLLSILAGFLWPGKPEGALEWAPFFALLAFNLLDLADGYAARRAGASTRLGEKLDLDLDGRGMLVSALLAFRFGAVGWWYLYVGLARYIYVAAIWLRERLGFKFAAQENRLRRPLAGAQMGIGTTLLAPGLPYEMTAFIAAFSMIPFLGNFLYDWWIGAGWLRVGKRQAQQWRAAWQRVGNWALLATRVALAALLVVRLSGVTFDTYFVLDAFFGLLLLAGLLGRPGAFAFLVATAFRLQGATVTSLDLALLFLGSVLLYLGVGAFSLRKLPEAWLFRRAGERKSK